MAPTLGQEGRVVGLDIHPDSFAAAILQGRDPLTARVSQRATGQALATLETWAARHTNAEDLLVLEASSNSFTVVERLEVIGRRAIILESHRAGQIGKAYLANDQLDAAKIARIYLSGLAIKVWRPDPETRQRRELLSTYQRCVKESTRGQQHLRSYLNEHSQRLPKGFRLCRPEALPRLLALREWSPRQRLLLEEMHGALIATRERRTRLRRMMALEIESTPDFLRLYKLCGLNLITTYALVAVIGDIGRFAHSKNLVAYLGLNPGVVQSGDFQGSTALRAHGRGSLRALLIQASKRLLTTVNPLQKWGLAVALRRGLNKAAVAVARKLAVAVWHVLTGHWNQALEETPALTTKLRKLATELGIATLNQLGYASKAAFQEAKLHVLRTHP
ncbi:MAG: IS110 family transposase [Verrucomicrobiota bacterium]|nr:IS110 family transposase [Verrucomicrobiota bacterium]